MGTTAEWLWVAVKMICLICSFTIWESVGKFLGYKGAVPPSTEAAIAWLIVAGFLYGFFDTFGLQAFKMPMITLTAIILVGLTAFGWLRRKSSTAQNATISQPR